MCTKKRVLIVFLFSILLSAPEVTATAGADVAVQQSSSFFKTAKQPKSSRAKKTLEQVIPTKHVAHKQPHRFEFPTLVEWTARCLSRDEMLSGSDWNLKPTFTAKEFMNTINLFLKKFKEKGVLTQLGINDPSRQNDSNDYKYPYVTSLDADNETVTCFTGDLHGSIHSLLRNLWRLVALGYLDKNFKLIKKNCYLIFLGDYTDRGRYGSEVMYTLLRLKIANWGRIYLVRGNHEVRSMNKQPRTQGGGFWTELTIKYAKQASKIFDKMCQVYQRLPLAIFITVNEQTLKAVHAGLGPYDYYYDTQNKKLRKNQPKRYHHIPLTDTDLTSPAFQWCDITQTLQQGSINGFTPDSGRVWSIDTSTLLKQLARANIKALFRGHQHGSFGFKMLFDQPTFQELTNRAAGRDTHSSLYHWTTVIKKTAPKDADENKKQGFKISKYIPLFTFSSAPEGVWGNHDCFGLLFTAGLYEDWRLKVYEFEAPMARTSEHKQDQLINAPFYTVIKKASPQQPTTGSAGIVDPIKASFFAQPKPPISEQKLKSFLSQVLP